MKRQRNEDGTFARDIDSKYIGKKYGKLTILEIYQYGKRNFKKCKCQCDCGNITEVYLSNLKRGFTKSCGCYRKNNAYDALTGQRFGNLLVIKELPKSKLGQTRYKCKCDCGNYIEVYGSNLIYNQTKSCGCLQDISCYSTKLFSTNTSGVRGVHFKKSTGKWEAKLTIKGDVHRKEFADFDKAVKHRKFLEDKYHKPLRERYNKLKSKK